MSSSASGVPASSAAAASVDTMTCPRCACSMRRGSLTRHLRDSCVRDRPTANASPYVPRPTGVTPTSSTRQSSQDCTATRPTTRRSSLPAVLTDVYVPTPIRSLADISSSMITEATVNLLEQHHAYSENQLCEYLATYFPEIPEASRRVIILAATTGARHAAATFEMYDRGRDSPDAAKRQVAADAACSLSYWGFGLRPMLRSGPAVSREPPTVEGRTASSHPVRRTMLTSHR